MVERLTRRSWVVVVGVSVVALGLRILAALAIHTPWVMTDELIYRELARSIAHGHGFDVRGKGIGLYSIYPVVLAPLWRLRMSTAYALSKVLGVVALTTLVPLTFLWGRRIVSPRAAVAAALLTAVLPAFVYTGELMSETLALPIGLVATMLIADAVVVPSTRRVALAGAAVLVEAAIRAEGLVLVPVWLTAIVAWELLAPPGGGSFRAALRRHRLVVGACALAVLVGAVVVALRGGGFYSGAAGGGYRPGAVVAWTLAHLAVVSVATGFVPAVALVLLVVQARRETLPSELRALVAVTISTVLWLVVGAGLWASRHGDGIRGRYLVYAGAPLVLCFVAWLERRPAVSRRARIAAPLVVCLAPLALPLGTVLREKVRSDAPSLAGLYLLRMHSSLWLAELVFVVIAVAGLAVTLRGGRLAALLFVAAVLGVSSIAAVRLADEQSSRVAAGDDTSGWIDRAAPPGAHVAFLLTGAVDPAQLWQSEFWNDDLASVFTLGADEPGPLPTSTPTIATDGRLVLGDATDVVVDRTVQLSGRPLARSTTGLELVPVDDTTRVVAYETGIRPDSSTAPTFTYTRPGCSGAARLIFALRSAPTAPPQTVVVRQGATVVARQQVAPGADVSIRAPLDAALGSCTLRFHATGGLVWETVLQLP